MSNWPLLQKRAAFGIDPAPNLWSGESFGYTTHKGGKGTWQRCKRRIRSSLSAKRCDWRRRAASQSRKSPESWALRTRPFIGRRTIVHVHIQFLRLLMIAMNILIYLERGELGRGIESNGLKERALQIRQFSLVIATNLLPHQGALGFGPRSRLEDR